MNEFEPHFEVGDSAANEPTIRQPDSDADETPQSSAFPDAVQADFGSLDKTSFAAEAYDDLGEIDAESAAGQGQMRIVGFDARTETTDFNMLDMSGLPEAPPNDEGVEGSPSSSVVEHKDVPDKLEQSIGTTESHHVQEVADSAESEPNARQQNEDIPAEATDHTPTVADGESIGRQAETPDYGVNEDTHPDETDITIPESLPEDATDRHDAEPEAIPEDTNDDRALFEGLAVDEIAEERLWLLDRQKEHAEVLEATGIAEKAREVTTLSEITNQSQASVALSPQGESRGVISVRFATPGVSVSGHAVSQYTYVPVADVRGEKLSARGPFTDADAKIVADMATGLRQARDLGLLPHLRPDLASIRDASTGLSSTPPESSENT